MATKRKRGLGEGRMQRTWPEGAETLQESAWNIWGPTEMTHCGWGGSGTYQAECRIGVGGLIYLQSRGSRDGMDKGCGLHQVNRKGNGVYCVAFPQN